MELRRGKGGVRCGSIFEAAAPCASLALITERNRFGLNRLAL
jgi:hypothetical protein